MYNKPRSSVLQWLYAIEHWGIDANASIHAAGKKKILYINRSCLLILGLIQFYCLIYLFKQAYVNIAVSEILALFWVIILFFNRLGWIKTARLLSVLAANGTIFFVTWFFSLKSGMQFYFIPAAIGSLFIYEYHEKPELLLAIFLPALLYIVAVFQFPLNPVNNQFNNADLLFFQQNSSFILSLLFSALFAWLHAFQHQISEQKLELALENAKAGELAKSNFISAMSHEMRTPVSSILGHCDNLSQTELSTQQQAYVNLVRNAGSNLLWMMNDILDFSELENTQLNLFYESVDINELMSDLKVRLTPLTEKKKLALKCHTDLALNRWFITDRRLIRLILSGLTDNAVKFTSSGYVSVDLLVESDDDHYQQIKLVVKDTGLGIEQDRQKDIFKRFTQLSDNMDRPYHGVGLGLSLVKKAVEKLRGQIQVISLPGSGSEFIVNLRLQKMGNEKNTNPNLNLFNNKKILLVDDDPIICELTAHTLKKFKLQVTLAGNGSDAIQLCRENTFDAIIMDIQMPECDGIEATKLIRSSGLNTETPIVALTANTESNTRVKALQAGMNDYMNKPVKKEQLLEMINTLLV